jgi:hypothetical protein
MKKKRKEKRKEKTNRFIGLCRRKLKMGNLDEINSE